MAISNLEINVTAIMKREEEIRARRQSAADLKIAAKAGATIMRYMNDDAREAMKRSAIECLTAQLVGILVIKHNEEVERQERDNRAKLHNISLFMGQLATLAERQTNTPDWGEW